MEYNYFVSFHGNAKYGNCLITLDHEIDSMDDIRAIEKRINLNADVTGCSVMSYQLLNSHASGVHGFTVEEAKPDICLDYE